MVNKFRVLSGNDKEQTPNADMANRYTTCTQIEHVKLRPNLYLGSIVPTERDAFLWENNQMVQKHNVPFVEGLVKMFDEAIDNAIDNTMISENPTTIIKVVLNEKEFKIMNNGRGIPCELMKDSTKLVPEVIFGECLSGSNFNEERTSIGANGLGIKLANIMSDWFRVACHDAGANKTFTCLWTNGMSKIDSKRVLSVTKNKFTTEVSFKPTLSRFQNNPGVVLKSITDMTPWVHTRLVQLMATHPNPDLKVYFNGLLIKCKGFKSFMKAFPSSHTFYDKPAVNFEYGISISSTGQFEHQSFVNCQMTPSANSTHTKYVTNTVLKLIRSYLTDRNKGSTASLSPSVISSKLNIFVNLRIKNPEFTSQTKIELASNITPCEFPINKGYVLGVLKKSGVLGQLEELLKAKVLDSVSKSLNGTKSLNVQVDKYDGAHKAGSTSSTACTLFVVEGDSAKTMVTVGLSVIGRSTFGVFPLRGKLLNVRAASPNTLKNNKEVQNLMKILGLNFAKTYETDAERRTLRYGKMCILTDADDDGHHITGLLLNFISFFWPCLSGQFFLRFVTPIIKATKQRKKTEFFFNQSEFETWMAATPTYKSYFIQHLKGLGTSERVDTISYFKDLPKHLKKMQFGPNTLDVAANIFDPQKTQWRKNWLTQSGDRKKSLDYSMRDVLVDDFFESELFQFSRSDIVRSIPSMIDGLKKSQRQALCGALQHFEKTNNQKFKVAQLSGIIASDMRYSHGEVSLQDTIISMAQGFVGSNNFPLFNTHGAFGSRMLNGKDAASARYIYTSLRDTVLDVFKREDKDVLLYTLEEGHVAQPDFYVPVIPLLLLNGSTGIATGFATRLPCFKITDIVCAVKNVLNGNTQDDPMPFYNDYQANDLTCSLPSKWVFKGKFVRESPTKIAITELPIGVSIDGYQNKVLQPLLQAKIIHKLKVDHIDENTPRFHVTTNEPFQDEKLMEVFKLTTSISKNCMYFLDFQGKVKQYHTIGAIIADYVQVKLNFTERRRLSLIKKTQFEIGKMRVKLRFLNLVNQGEIQIHKHTKSEIEERMLQMGIPQDSFSSLLSLGILSFSQDNMLHLQKKITDAEREITNLEAAKASDIYLRELDLFCGKINNKKRKRDT